VQVVAVTALVDAPRSTPDFRSIYDREVAYVWQSLRRLGVREHDIEDVAHEVFVTVHRRLVDFDPTRPLRPWIFGIALRTASDYRRSARFRREIPQDVTDTAVELPAMDEQLAAEDARQLVMEALETLDLDARAVLVMHDLDEQPAPVIAATMGVPLNTVYSRLRLARKSFTQAARRLRLRRGEA
jgi:RNA polymerase sigma-70 factor (ECF subfamily)